VAELLLGLPVPIVYFEQGHEWLFGDPIRFQVKHAAQAATHARRVSHLLNVADDSGTFVVALGSVFCLCTEFDCSSLYPSWQSTQCIGFPGS